MKKPNIFYDSLLLRISLIRAEIIKIRQYKFMSTFNFGFAVLSILIQLSILNLFVHEKELWNSTVVYTITALGIGQINILNKVPIYAEMMISGNILKYYIRPTKIFTSIIFEELGNSILNFIQVSPFFIVSIFFSLQLTDTNLLNIFLFFISMILGVILAILLGTAFYTITFYTTNYQGAKALLGGVNSFLSGAMLPIILWPEQLQSIVRYTPFALVVDAPINFLINVYTSNSMQVLGYQLLWIIILYFVCKKLILFFERRGNFYGG